MASSQGLFADYLTKKEFCAAVPGGPIAERTADHRHARRIGPPRIRVSNVVLYPKARVQAWLDRRLAEAEAEYAEVEAGR